MDYIQLNLLLELYDNLYNDIYDKYFDDFSTDKNLIFIENIDFVSTINFIRRSKGFLVFDDIDTLKSYIIDVCFLYSYWEEIRTKEDHNKDVLEINIKHTVSYINDSKSHLLDKIHIEFNSIMNSLMNN